MNTTEPEIDVRPRRLRPWAVLLAGFGGLIILLLAAAANAYIAFNTLGTHQAAIREAFFKHHSTLETIRAHIYLSGTYIRDYLLAPEPRGADAQRTRMVALERENRAALDQYAASLDPAERKDFQDLRAAIDAYWRLLDSTFSWSSEQRDKLRYSFFYEELLPRRTSMLEIADRIADINDGAFSRAEERLTASAERSRWSLVFITALILLSGVTLAVLTTVYMLRLENELERRLAENVRSRAELRDLSARLVRTQEDERRALARELHDEVGQSLSAILMEAGHAHAAEDYHEVQQHVGSIKQMADKTVNVVRDLALLLRPSMLDDFGLVPALQWLGRETSKRTGLKVHIAADDGGDDLPSEHQTCIYRLVQEAVNNAAQHANARTVEVTVNAVDTTVNLTVKDDGCGFDTHYVRGLGLVGMEERVRRLGGQLRLHSEPGRGTVVSVELPLADIAARNASSYAHSHSAG